MTKEREAFEAWMRDAGQSRYLKRDDSHPEIAGYEDSHTTMMWCAWQASRMRALEEAAAGDLEDAVYEAVREAGLDWHMGFALDDQENRYVKLVRAYLRALKDY